MNINEWSQQPTDIDYEERMALGLPAKEDEEVIEDDCPTKLRRMSSLNITKKYSNTYEIVHAIASKPFMKFGKFIVVRRRRGMSTEMWEKCFGCNHDFTDDEDVYMGAVTKKGNIFFCKSCVEKYNTEKKIESEEENHESN